MSVSLAFEKGQDGEEFFVQIEQEFAMRARSWLATGVGGGRCCASFVFAYGGGGNGAAAVVAARKVGKMFAGTGDREAFLVEEALDFENGFDVVAAIEAMAAGTFHGLERGKFSFPVAKDERLGGRQAADFADAEKTLFRNFRRSLRGTGHVFCLS